MASPTTTSYWCYRCTRLVRVWVQDSIACPYCESGFLEEIESAPSSENLRRPLTPSFIHGQDSFHTQNLSSRRTRRRSGDRSPFNPVIVLRRSSDDGAEEGERNNNFELYYDDGTSSGLRPLPASMSEFLMGSGFDRLLEQLAQIEISGIGRYENPPASKAAIESLPAVEIVASHVQSDLHCAVCKEAFELGTEAQEMPCKHMYHSDCILPWLSLRNSCPVCRHELPTEPNSVNSGESPATADEDTVGLTIWRLPGGGFSVGRFARGRRAGDREPPVVYTEMDDGFNSVGAPRRVSWGSRRSRGSENSRGIGRLFRNLASLFWRNRSNSSSTTSSSTLPSSRSVSESGSFSRSHSHSSSVFGGHIRRRSRGWVLDDQNGNERW